MSGGRAALVLALLFTASAPAAAAPREPNDAAADDAARSRYAEGIKLYKRRRYEEARAAFLQSSALHRRPETTYMLAQSALKAGRWVEALRGFEQFKSEVNGEIPAKLAELYEAGRREAASHVAHLRFDVPSDAEVALDGDRLATTDGTVDVMPGPHIVVVTSRGEKKVETIEVEAGRTATVKPAFLPKALVPSPEPRARPAPAAAPEAQSEEKRAPTLLTPPETRWPIYVAGGVGLGGIALAAIFGGLQSNANHAIDVSQQTLARAGYDNASCRSRDNFDRQEGDAQAFEETCITLAKNNDLADAHGAIVIPSLIVGTAGLGIAIGWFLFAAKPGERAEEKRAAPSVSPWIGQGGGGATVIGRF